MSGKDGASPKSKSVNSSHGVKEDSDLEEYYKLFLDKTSDAIFFADTNGKIFKSNPAASILFGYTEEEFRQIDRKKIQDLSNPD